ncbi:hypothetical protein [Alteromonas sp. KUL106]|uniref:hypothetical protein n=1 Tax=Alteromonas sp. KUL106 TaxID=2480799 RepID=UPI00135A6751|nr:hypothetical protein [Alteromonas sp. KUL106]
MPFHAKANSFSRLYRRVSACFGGTLKYLVKPISVSSLSLCSLLVFTGAAYSSAVNQGVSVFSTYPSDALLNSCHSQRQLINVGPSYNDTLELCSEDAISPDRFIKVLSESGEFSNLRPYGEGNDYELLIANVGAAPGEHPRHAKQFAEFTLQWRGIEIDSSQFDAGEEITDNSNEQSLTNEKEAQLLITRWLEHVKQSGLFTSQFLFHALQASNYSASLQVPDSVGEFIKLDTQLFSDPFSGAITRYTHPDFEDALVDVTVYPFLAQLSSEESELLPKQLESDLQKASATAELQHLTLSQVSPAARYSVNDNVVGWRLGLSATSDTSPTIYATTYVFRQQDKIVKVSTTFPPDFSDTIVNQLIVNVEVPQESEMMKKVRSMLLETQR